MKKVVTALIVVLLPAPSNAEVDDEAPGCSIAGFAAYGQTWADVPIMPGAMLVQPSIDGSSCAFAVEAQLPTIEEWYQRRLVADGWRPVERKELDKIIVLYFERDLRKFRLSLMQSHGAIVVLLTRPEPDKAMEPTR